MAYMALEPAVRARWPHSLITWNRLLDGQFADSRVGSHILVGAAIGMAILAVLMWGDYIRQLRGGAPFESDLRVLLGVRQIISSHAATIVNALQAGLAGFFLLCGVRAIARRDWLAAAVVAILASLAEDNMRNSTNLALDLSLYLPLYFGLTYALIRLGLVTMIVALYCVNTASRVAIGPDFTTWYNYVGVFEIGAIAAVAIYGFWRSQSSRAGWKPAADC
jgi:serine/threonine-protein kinase